jgi:hypothetical protein
MRPSSGSPPFVEPLLTPSRGIIILSHNQPVSSFDNEYPNIARQLSERLKELAGRSLLWLWGHEHRLAAYGQYDVGSFNAFGRCLGHGGMPMATPLWILETKN